MAEVIGYGPYDKRYDFGPNLRGEAKREAERHEDAVRTLLGAAVPWLDVYSGDLKHEMAEEFIASLQYGDMSEHDVVTAYLNGEYDVDALLDSRLEKARNERMQAAQHLGDAAVSVVRLGVSVSECLETGYITTTTFEMPMARSFG